MTTSAKSPKTSLASIEAQLAAIRTELAHLSALLAPTSVPALQALAKLQQTICETARKHIDPRQHALDEIVERMSEDVGANLARDIIAAIEVRVEPFLPLLMQMLADAAARRKGPPDAV